MAKTELLLMYDTLATICSITAILLVDHSTINKLLSASLSVCLLFYRSPVSSCQDLTHAVLFCPHLYDDDIRKNGTSL